VYLSALSYIFTYAFDNKSSQLKINLIVCDSVKFQKYYFIKFVVSEFMYTKTK